MLSDYTVLAEERKESVCSHVDLLCCSFKCFRHGNITSNEVAITKAAALISPFGTRDNSRGFSSHLSQIPLKYKVNLWSFSTDFKGISVASSEAMARMSSVLRCLRGYMSNCCVSGNNTAAAGTVCGIYCQSSVKKILLGFANWYARAFSWDGEGVICTSKTEPCLWTCLPSSFRS